MSDTALREDTAMTETTDDTTTQCPIEGCPCGATTLDEHDTRDAE